MTIIIFLLFFIVFEIFESSWQKADSFYEVINNNYKIYKKNLFFYFLLNPTFIYSLFLSFYLNNFGFWMSSIIVIKFADISFRLYLMQKITKNESFKNIIPIDITMNIYIRYINVAVYPLCFIFSLANL